MATFIRRKKHLNEAGENPQASTTQTNGQTAPAANTNANQTPANGQPAQTQNNAQPADQNAQNQNNANANQAQNQNNTQQQGNNQQQQQNQQQPDPKIVERNKNVTECLNGIRDIIQKNDPYALIAFDMPAAMQAKVPDFTKDNPDAKATMEAWGKFKDAPSKETFDTVINEFSTFGNGGQKPDQNTQAQAAQEAVQVQAKVESMSRTFSEKLNERLQHQSQMTHYENVLTKYWSSPKL